MKSNSGKTVPQRSCIICGKKKAKSGLLRIVFQGSPVYDELQVLPGRGHYICSDLNCIEKSRDGKALRRAFRQRLISVNDISELVNTIINAVRS